MAIEAAERESELDAPVDEPWRDRNQLFVAVDGGFQVALLAETPRREPQRRLMTRVEREGEAKERIGERDAADLQRALPDAANASRRQIDDV